MACSPTLDCFIMERETPPELSFITLNGGEVRFQEEIRHTNGITFSGSDDIGNKFYFNLHLSTAIAMKKHLGWVIADAKSIRDEQ